MSSFIDNEKSRVYLTRDESRAFVESPRVQERLAKFQAIGNEPRRMARMVQKAYVRGDVALANLLLRQIADTYVANDVLARVVAALNATDRPDERIHLSLDYMDMVTTMRICSKRKIRVRVFAGELRRLAAAFDIRAGMNTVRQFVQLYFRDETMWRKIAPMDVIAEVMANLETRPHKFDLHVHWVRELQVALNVDNIPCTLVASSCSVAGLSDTDLVYRLRPTFALVRDSEHGKLLVQLLSRTENKYRLLAAWSGIAPAIAATVIAGKNYGPDVISVSVLAALDDIAAVCADMVPPVVYADIPAAVVVSTIVKTAVENALTPRIIRRKIPVSAYSRAHEIGVVDFPATPRGHPVIDMDAVTILLADVFLAAEERAYARAFRLADEICQCTFPNDLPVNAAVEVVSIISTALVEALAGPLDWRTNAVINGALFLVEHLKMRRVTPQVKCVTQSPDCGLESEVVCRALLATANSPTPLFAAVLKAGFFMTAVPLPLGETSVSEPSPASVASAFSYLVRTHQIRTDDDGRTIAAFVDADMMHDFFFRVIENLSRDNSGWPHGRVAEGERVLSATLRAVQATPSNTRCTAYKRNEIIRQLFFFRMFALAKEVVIAMPTSPDFDELAMTLVEDTQRVELARARAPVSAPAADGAMEA